MLAFDSFIIVVTKNKQNFIAHICLVCDTCHKAALLKLLYTVLLFFLLLHTCAALHYLGVQLCYQRINTF
jgi:hypothetical protein